MGALDAVEWESALLEPVRDRDAQRQLLRARLAPPAAVYFLDVPWLVRAMIAFNLSRVPLIHLTTLLGGLIALVVSQDNACRYCYSLTRGILRISGFPDERVQRLEEDLLTADLPAADRRALELARRVSRANPLPGPIEAQPLLDAGLSKAAIVEVVAQTALNIFANRAATLPALPPEPLEQMTRRWWFRPLRPIIARLLRPPRGATVTLTAEQRHGVFADFVNAIDGLPLATRLRVVLDEAWASTVLSRRQKALIVAVVARGLGSSAAEAEALRLLAADGLGENAAYAVLANLDGPELDAVERIVVPFARETIWYQPAALQRRARSVRAQLSRAQFVELIGIAALANSICRLSLALDLTAGHG